MGENLKKPQQVITKIPVARNWRKSLLYLVVTSNKEEDDDIEKKYANQMTSAKLAKIDLKQGLEFKTSYMWTFSRVPKRLIFNIFR